MPVSTYLLRVCLGRIRTPRNPIRRGPCPMARAALPSLVPWRLRPRSRHLSGAPTSVASAKMTPAIYHKTVAEGARSLLCPKTGISLAEIRNPNQSGGGGERLSHTARLHCCLCFDFSGHAIFFGPKKKPQPETPPAAASSPVAKAEGTPSSPVPAAPSFSRGCSCSGSRIHHGGRERTLQNYFFQSRRSGHLLDLEEVQG